MRPKLLFNRLFYPESSRLWQRPSGLRDGGLSLTDEGQIIAASMYHFTNLSDKVKHKNKAEKFSLYSTKTSRAVL